MDMPVQTPIGELQPTLARLRAAHRSKVPDYAQRRDDLARLRGVFKARLDDMVIAIVADFGHRSRHETLVSDGMTVLAEIDVMRRHLREWMRVQPRPVDAMFLPARDR